MDKNYLMEKLSALRNEMSHLWGGIFVVGGGSSTLVLIANKSLAQIIFCIIGFLLMLIFFNAYLIKRVAIEDILNKLKEDK